MKYELKNSYRWSFAKAMKSTSFKGIKSLLLVDYKSNKKAWMTLSLFRECNLIEK